MSTTWDPSTTAEVCRRLRLPVDTHRLTNLVRLVRRQGPAIAVVGLISRGKSTLVNDIVGVELSSVSATPETACTLAVSRGEPAAFGDRGDGLLVDLPTDPEEFRSVVERRQGGGFRDVEYLGDVRLPTGITLVDTPGVDEAGMAADGQLDAVQVSWAESGATEAIMVISVPPGTSSSDRRLLDAALTAFDNRVQLVVKATDSGVTIEDLELVADDLAGQTGAEVIVIEPSVPGGGSGSSGVAAIRTLLERVAGGRATRSTDGPEPELDSMISDAAAAVGLVGTGRLDILRDIEPLLDGCEPLIAAAVRERLEWLDGEARALLRAAEDEAHDRRLAVLDDSARELHRSLPTEAILFDAPLHGATVIELAALAEQGSRVAAGALAVPMTLPELGRSRLGIPFKATLARIPVSLWSLALGGSARSVDDAIVLLDLSRIHPDAVEFARNTVRGVLSVSPDAADLRRMLTATTEDELERELISTYLVSVEHLLTKCGSEWAAISSATFRRARTAIDHAEFAVELTPTSSSDTARQNHIGALRLWIAEVAAARLEPYARLITSEAVGDLGSWRRECRSVGHDVAVWAKAIAPSEDLELWAERFSPEGPIDGWAAHSVEAQARASVHAIQNQNNWKTAYAGSFVLWVFAFFLLGADPAVAFFVWLGAFILWLVAG